MSEQKTRPPVGEKKDQKQKIGNKSSQRQQEQNIM